MESDRRSPRRLNIPAAPLWTREFANSSDTGVAFGRFCAGGGLVPGNSIHLEIRNHIYSPLKTLDGGVGGARQQTSLSASSMRFL
ncbi:hypothetical protein DTO207G8_4490 [Paecilomyces variotii]|nr:hypothetical protein DTO207G8_4490 [Paecilomyces variotii]KAJ9406537.1 hypothetical protein DTO045G8_5708 [Paecilomyces variotii]